MLSTLKPLKYWLPVAAWMLLIYGVSSDSMSLENTSRFMDPLLRWIFPSLAGPELAALKLLIRKLGHVFEYAVLAALWWSALRHLNPAALNRWNWWVPAQAFLMTVAYAITDEFHQTFVANRVGTPWDVLIDSAGAALGILITYLIFRWRHPPGPHSGPRRFTRGRPQPD